jgi:hypothetical protein
MLLASAATGVRQGNVAGFPAIRTVVEAVCAQAHVVLTFADGAVLLAREQAWGLQGKLYLTMARRGKEPVASLRRIAYSPSPISADSFQRFAGFVQLRLLIRFVL